MAESARRKKERPAGGEDDDLPPDQRVRVAVRIRPHNRADHGDASNCLSVSGQRITADSGQKSFSFSYDNVFHDANQEQVYQALGEQMLHDAFSGYNSTIFAYGQTGSGKTYSMLGTEDDPVHEGLLPRLCKELFELSQELMAEDPNLVVKIQVSFVEVYNERIRDLLQFDSTGRKPNPEELKDLKLKEDRKSRTFYVEGLTYHTVMNYGRVRNLIDVGTALRTKAETGMNELSSRSHSVFCIYLSQTHERPNPAHKDMESRITVVDLAGSERQSKTDLTSAIHSAEAEKINMSLLILGRCLSACSGTGAKHIPVRESVLTKMLMDIFGGNSKTIMFATVSPSLFNFQETTSTLQYAHNAKKIQHKAKQNTLAKAVEIQELKEQVKALGRTLIEELEKASHEKDLLLKEIEHLSEEKELLSSSLATSAEENRGLKEELARLREQLKAAQEQASRPAALLEPKNGTSPTTASPARSLSGGGGAEPGLFGTVLPPGAPALLAAMAGEEGEGEGEEGDAEREAKLKQLQMELTTVLTPRNSQRLPFLQPQPQAAMPPLATATELRSYRGHLSAVYACALSPTGDKMVSASRDKTVKVWSVAGGVELTTLRGHTGFVLSCCYSPNGRDVASAAEDNTIKIWDGDAGRKIVTLKGHNDKVYCVAYSPSGVEVVSASSDKTVKVWNVDSNRKLVTLRGHQSAVFGASFSHDGRKVVSAADDKTVRVWDWISGGELCCFEGHTGTVWSCCFSPSDEQVLSSSMDGTMRLWDVETRVSLRTYRGHSAPVHHATFAKDGANIVSASRDRSLKVWDTESGKVISTLLGHTNTVYRCDVHNNLILSCSSDETLKAWSLKLH